LAQARSFPTISAAASTRVQDGPWIVQPRVRHIAITRGSTKECIERESRWRGTRPETRPEAARTSAHSTHQNLSTRYYFHPASTLTTRLQYFRHRRSPTALPRLIAGVAMSSRATKQPHANPKSLLSDIAWFGFKLGFGLTSLASVWVIAVLKNGVLWAKDTEEEKRELAAAQQKHWSLDREPLPGFRHAFFTTSTGTRIHYVTNANAETSNPQNVGIFVHGMLCKGSPTESPTNTTPKVSPIRTSSGAISFNRPSFSAITSS
jgi:hypothetical protein